MILSYKSTRELRTRNMFASPLFARSSGGVGFFKNWRQFHQHLHVGQCRNNSEQSLNAKKINKKVNDPVCEGHEKQKLYCYLTYFLIQRENKTCQITADPTCRMLPL